MKHKIGTCPNANPDSDELCPVCHKCKEPECTRGEGHTGLHFSESKMPPKTNEEWVDTLLEAAYEFKDNYEFLEKDFCVVVRTLLTEKDKEKEEAVAEERKRIAKILLEDDNKVVQAVGRALTPTPN